MLVHRKMTSKLKGTHSLEKTGGRTKSGHGRKSTKGGALTLWRLQSEEQIKIQKESSQRRGTHILETIERGTSHSYNMDRSDQARNTHQLETTEGGTFKDMEEK